jgi:hypothetical protein
MQRSARRKPLPKKVRRRRRRHRPPSIVKLLFPVRNRTCKWTDREYEALLLHIELLGPQWDLIAASMRRSRLALAGKLTRERWRRENTRTIALRSDDAV